MAPVTRRGLQCWLRQNMERLRSGHPAADMRRSCPSFQGLHHAHVQCSISLAWASGSDYGRRLVEVKLSPLAGTYFYRPSRVSVKVAAAPQFTVKITRFQGAWSDDEDDGAEGFHAAWHYFGFRVGSEFEHSFTALAAADVDAIYQRISEIQHIRKCSACANLFSGGGDTCPACVLTINSEDSSDEGEDASDPTGAGVCLVCQGDLPSVVECGACSARLHQRCFQQLVQRTRGSRRCPQCRAADMTAGVGSRKRKRD